MTKEIWKPIPGYDGYEASSLGRVRSVDRYDKRGVLLKGRVLKPTRDRGYSRVNLSVKGKRFEKKVHRLVMLTFRGESLLPVDHRDGNKDNNCLSNLEYVTARENLHRALFRRDHKLPIGVSRKGEKYHVRFHENGVRRFVGSYPTIEQAVVAYGTCLEKSLA